MKKILVIASHPDDEILGCGGTMAKLAYDGAKVSVALLTGGIQSRYDKHNPEMQREMQKIAKHAIKANNILGVKASDIHFLGFEDQKLDVVPFLEITKSIKHLINTIKPDEVYTHHHGDYNNDHTVCAKATLVATRVTPGEFYPKKLYAYEVLSSSERSFGIISQFIPNTYVNIGNFVKKKEKALSAYKTELKKYPHPRSIKGVEIHAAKRGIEIGSKFAEAFQLIRSVDDQ
jgi:LmbE family N-acetylglucosaminyl deacetylase